jgi:hypothetical protein
MKRKAISITLSIVLAVMLLCGAACTGKVATRPKITGDDVLRAAKTFGLALGDALDEAIPFEQALAQDGTIDKEVEPKIRQGLGEAKVAVDAFNARAAGYQHFDATSEADIRKLRDDTLSFVDRLNTEGILRIKNAKSQLIATAIIAGVKIAIRLYDAERERLQAAQ